MLASRNQIRTFTLWELPDKAPAWRELFEKVTETALYPLPYCSHRWCESGDCAHCIELILPAIINFIKYLEKEPKSKQPQGKSFQISREGIKDPIAAKLKLVEHIARKLNNIFPVFQTDQSVVLFCVIHWKNCSNLLWAYLFKVISRNRKTVLRSY